MKTMIGTEKLWTAIAAIFYALAPVETFSQQRDSIVAETLAVAARPSSDSITLRWAPLSFKPGIWRTLTAIASSVTLSPETEPCFQSQKSKFCRKK